MKHLRAEKCKDGWAVEITDTRVIFSESDVLKLIKQNGLQEKSRAFKEEHIVVKNKKGKKIGMESKITNETIIIYAD